MSLDPRTRLPMPKDLEMRTKKALRILSKQRGYPVTQVTPGEMQWLQSEGLIEPTPDGGTSLESLFAPRSLTPGKPGEHATP